MSIGAGIALFVIGAILAFAVNLPNDYVSLSMIGYIMMGAGVVVFLIGVVLLVRRRQTDTVTRTEGVGAPRSPARPRARPTTTSSESSRGRHPGGAPMTEPTPTVAYDSSADELFDGRYRLGRLLGRGGYARVYEAVDTALERTLAIKVIDGDGADPSDVARVRSEIRLLASLSHPSLSPSRLTRVSMPRPRTSRWSSSPGRR